MSTMVILFRLFTLSSVSLLGLPRISNTRWSRGEREHSPPFLVLREMDVVPQYQPWAFWDALYQSPQYFQFDILSWMDFELYAMCFLYKLIWAYNISSSVNLLWKITLILLRMLDQAYIPGVNIPWLCYHFLIYCYTWLVVFRNDCVHTLAAIAYTFL